MTPTTQQIRSLVIDAGFNWVPCTNEVYAPSGPINDAITRLVTLALERYGQTAAQQEPVGIVGPMPGTSGFTMACFKAGEVPVGTELYTAPQPAEVREPAVVIKWQVGGLVAHIVGDVKVGDLLYTHPAPAEVREPLSDDWIRYRCNHLWVYETAKQWVRATEAAHGITGSKT